MMFFSSGAVMKTFLMVMTWWALTVTMVFAQSSIEPRQKWVMQVDGGYSTPVFREAHKLDPGYGGDIGVGYRFNRTFALFFGTGYYRFNIPFASMSTQLTCVPVDGVFRMTFGKGHLHPYVFCGLGGITNTFTKTDFTAVPTSKTSQTEINFYMAPGLGIMYVFSKNKALFIQTRMGLDFTTYNGFGIPMSSPSVFIPVQVGISVFTH
jgi:hypothetical protein